MFLQLFSVLRKTSKAIHITHAKQLNHNCLACARRLKCLEKRCKDTKNQPLTQTFRIFFDSFLLIRFHLCSGPARSYPFRPVHVTAKKIGGCLATSPDVGLCPDRPDWIIAYRTTSLRTVLPALTT